MTVSIAAAHEDGRCIIKLNEAMRIGPYEEVFFVI